MKILPGLLLLATLASTAPAADRLTIPLWPEGVPNAKADIGPEQNKGGWVTQISEPRLEYFPAAGDQATQTAVVVCPGGGYAGLARDHEGYQYAQWLNSLGVSSFVLTYRVREFGHPAPLQDVLRALRIVRSRAAEFHLDPARIGVMGSSAGGHLSACAGTLYDNPAGQTGAPLDAVSARPDFLILMYPVITLDDPYTHASSRELLLGKTPSPELLQLMSPEKHVTAQTPPTLLVHSQNDNVVPVQNSLLFFDALTRAGVPAEMYIYEKSPHGIGLHRGVGNAATWPKRAEEWLRFRGLLTPPTPAAATN